MESYVSLKFCSASWLLSIIMNIHLALGSFFGPSAILTWVSAVVFYYLLVLFLFVSFLFFFFPFLANTWMLATGTAFYYMYVGVLTSCMFVQHIHAMPPEEGIGSPGTWSALWVLGSKPGSFGRASSVLTMEPSFQPPPLSFYFIFILSKLCILGSTDNPWVSCDRVVSS